LIELRFSGSFKHSLQPEVEAAGMVIFVMLLVTVLVAAAGIWLAFGRHRAGQRDLGVGLLTGATFGLAVFLLQVVNDRNATEIQKRQQQAATRETVQLAIATTSDLSGFDPRGEPLKGTYLAGKSLKRARFKDVNLTRAELRDANLTGALLQGAQLNYANLINANLTDADLTDADLSGAKVHAAKFDAAGVEKVKSLKGAVANADTCWPTGFLEGKHTADLVAQLKSDPIQRPSGKLVPPSKGHTCPEDD
jgi:hypothetical protein